MFGPKVLQGIHFLSYKIPAPGGHRKGILMLHIKREIELMKTYMAMNSWKYGRWFSICVCLNHLLAFFNKTRLSRFAKQHMYIMQMYLNSIYK